MFLFYIILNIVINDVGCRSEYIEDVKIFWIVL